MSDKTYWFIGGVAYIMTTTVIREAMESVAWYWQIAALLGIQVGLLTLFCVLYEIYDLVRLDNALRKSRLRLQNAIAGKVQQIVKMPES